MMGIDRAGAPFVGGALVLAALAAWLGSGWWWAIPFVLLAAFLGFFFRDPDASSAPTRWPSLSPADGRVMVAGPGRAGGRARGRVAADQHLPVADGRPHQPRPVRRHV